MIQLPRPGDDNAADTSMPVPAAAAPHSAAPHSAAPGDDVTQHAAHLAHDTVEASTTAEERAAEVEAARQRATPALVGEWRPPCLHCGSSTSNGESHGHGGVDRRCPAADKLDALTVINTTEPLLFEPLAPQHGPNKNGNGNGNGNGKASPVAPDTDSHRAFDAHDAAAANGLNGSGNGVGTTDAASTGNADGLTVAHPDTSDDRRWRQIERADWAAPDGEPELGAGARYTLRHGVPNDYASELDDVDTLTVSRQARQRKRRLAAVILILAVVAAIVAWFVVAGTSDAGGNNTASPAADAEATPTTAEESVVVPTPTAPNVEPVTAEPASSTDIGQTDTLADDAVDETPGTEDSESTATNDETGGGEPTDDVVSDATTGDGSSDNGLDGATTDTAATTTPAAGDTTTDTTAPTTSAAVDTAPAQVNPPTKGSAQIGTEAGTITFACTSFPFDPVSADYQLFSFSVRTDSARWVVDRWYDTDIDGIFLRELGSGTVSTGSATDTGNIIEGNADNTDVLINPPDSAFDECQFVVRTSPTDIDNEPYTQAIVDSCVVTTGTENRVIGALTEGGSIEVLDRGDGTADITYSDDDLNASLTSVDGVRAIDGTVATWSARVEGGGQSQLIEIVADTASLPACTTDQIP